MKVAFTSLLIALAASTVSTAAPQPAQQPTAAVAPSADRLELARRFMAMSNSNDSLKMMRKTLARMAAANAESPEDKAAAERFMDRVFVLAEPKLSEHMTAILEATAQAYAREFSADELQQMIAFAQSPTGKHYLSRGPDVETDPAILDAQIQIWTELGPFMEQVGKEMCAEKAAKRTAAGDKNAKCPLSKASETKRG
jgi:hypothetical protein